MDESSLRTGSNMSSTKPAKNVVLQRENTQLSYPKARIYVQ